jgi:hypothetical protein
MAYASPAPIALSKIHEDSGPTVSAHLELFRMLPTETSCIGGESWVSVRPSTDTTTSAQLELQLNASDERYTDLRESYAIVDCKVVKADGSSLDADPDNFDVYPVTNLPHALFESLTVKVGDNDVEHNAAYSTTSYLRSLLDESESTKRGRLTAEGWINDDALARDEADAPDEDKLVRKLRIAGSRKMSFMMRFDFALARQELFLPPGVGVQLRLHRSQPSVCLMSSNADNGCKVIITGLEWKVRRVGVNPAIGRAHLGRLVEGNKCNIRVDKHRTRAFTVPQGVTEHRVVISQGDALPTRLAIALQPHAAFVGSYKRSPFKFTPHDLSSIEVTVDGVPVGPRLETDFANKRYARAYAHTLVSLGRLHSRYDNGIDYEAFGDNKTVFVWSLATDLPNKDSHLYFHLRRKATLAVALRFKTPPTTPLTLLALDQNEDLIRVDLERNVRSQTGAA